MTSQVWGCGSVFAADGNSAPRRLRWRPRLVAVAAIFGAIVAVAGIADASCNVIPGTEKNFLGTLANVDRPFAGPGDFVDLWLNPDCHSASPGFEVNPANSVVTVVFTPRQPGGSTSHNSVLVLANNCAALQPQRDACALQPGVETVACVDPSVTLLSNDIQISTKDGLRHLKFRIPQNLPFVASGPASIAVTTPSDPLPCGLAAQSCSLQTGLRACVDTLYEIDGTCGSTPDRTFSHFTVLPPPNSFADLCVDPQPPCTGLASSVLFTTDLDGNVLVPMNWHGILVPGGLPVGRLLRGATSFEAFQNTGQPIKIPGNSFVRSFSPEGGALAPIFDPQSDPSATSDVTLFGSADAPRTVLRVLRRSSSFMQCSGGPNDGLPCIVADDCPGGVCGPTVCNGGGNAGSLCSADVDCPGGECGPALFEFRDRYQANTGPIRISRFNIGVCQGGSNNAAACTSDPDCPGGICLSGTCQDGIAAGTRCTSNGDCPGSVCVGYRMAVEDPFALDGGFCTEQMCAFVRPESTTGQDINGDNDATDEVVVIRDRKTGVEHAIGVTGSTGRAVTRLHTPPYSFPIVSVENDVAAFLEPEALQGNCNQPRYPFEPISGDCDKNGDGDTSDTILRVFRSDGTDLTSGMNIAVDAEGLVNGRSLVVSNGLVYFRQPEWGSTTYSTNPASVSESSEIGDLPSGGERIATGSDVTITSDGRFVAFASYANNLVADDNNMSIFKDVFVRDRDADQDGVFDETGAGETGLVRVSVDTDGSELVPPGGYQPVLSTNGRHVLFRASDGTSSFLRDRDTDGNGVFDEPGGVSMQHFPSVAVDLSGDGRYVLFADGQVLDRDTDGDGVFDEPGFTQTTNPANCIGCAAKFISKNGRHIVFEYEIFDRDTDGNGVFDEPGGVATIAIPQPAAGLGFTDLKPVGISDDARVIALQNLLTPMFIFDRDADGNGVFDEPGKSATDRIKLSLPPSTYQVCFFYDPTCAESPFGLTNTGVSSDGRYLTFPLLNNTGFATHDRLTGLTRLVRPGVSSGLLGPADGASNGNEVVFATTERIAPEDTNGVQDAYMCGLNPSDLSGDLTGDGDVNDTVLRIFDTGTSTIETLCPATQVAVATSGVAFLRPEAAGDAPGCPPGPDLNGDGDTADTVVQLWPLYGSVENLYCAATAIARSDRWIAALVPQGAQHELKIYDTMQPPPSSCNDWIDVGPATAVQVVGDTVAYVTPNKVLRLYFPALGAPAPSTEKFVGTVDDEFVLGGTIVAFRTLESMAGQDLNGDGDQSDSILQVYDITNDRLFNTGQAAIPCPLEACDIRTPYTVANDTVTFVTLESQQGRDLNGDGQLGLVKQSFNVALATATSPALASKVIGGLKTGICTQTGNACTNNGDCPGGKCFLPPGACLEDLGTSCNPNKTNACGAGAFCVPLADGSGAATCQIDHGTCRSQADCTAPAVCSPQDQHSERIVAPLNAGGVTGDVFVDAGRCLETFGACASDSNCAAGQFCGDGGACQALHGSCLHDTDCPQGAVCRRDLIVATARDTDGDEISDPFDNCPNVFNPGQEDTDGDGIGDACDVQTCRNGIVEGTEQCDDGNAIDGDGCDSNCTLTACGNGITTAATGETCDDGNRVAGDGCDASCHVESGYNCAGLPSSCVTQTPTPAGGGAPTPTPTPTATGAPGTPTPFCVNIASDDVPHRIPEIDNLYTLSSVTVPALPGTISDVDVTLIGTHPQISDLFFALYGPHGNAVHILDASDCGSFQDFNLKLDDGAASFVCPFGPTIGGLSYIPNAPLTVFNGQTAGGVWTLGVIDLGVDTSLIGNLTGWSLHICIGGSFPVSSTPTPTATLPPTPTPTPVPPGAWNYKLNAPLVAGGDVLASKLSADSTWAVYLADQDVFGVPELYSVQVALGAASVVKLNTGGHVLDFAISPDSGRVIYIADQDTPNVQELYSAPIGGGTLLDPVIKLNPGLTIGHDVRDFAISPDSSYVVYRADQDTDGTDELYSVPIAGGSSPANLDAMLPMLGNVSRFAITPDSSRVAYVADPLADGRGMLFSVLSDGSGLQLLSGLPRPGGSVIDFKISPDSSFVVYASDEDPTIAPHEYELWTVPIDSNVGGGGLSYFGIPEGASFGDRFAITPDSNRIVFLAHNIGRPADYELLSIDRDTPGSGALFTNPFVLLSGDAAAGFPTATVKAFELSPDGSLAVYERVDQRDTVNYYQSLNAVSTDGLQFHPSLLSTTASPYLVGVELSITPDNQYLVGTSASVFSADAFSVSTQGTSGFQVTAASTCAVSHDGAHLLYKQFPFGQELDSVSTNIGTAVMINGPMVAGGGVVECGLSPNDHYVVYRADQETDGVFELWATSYVRCGDGIIVSGETCDDGGTATGDGCDDHCLIEPGYTCTGEPSVCTAFTPTPSKTPTLTPTPTQTPTITPTPTRTLSPTNTLSPSNTPTRTLGPSPTALPSCGNGVLDPGEACEVLDASGFDVCDGCGTNCLTLATGGGEECGPALCNDGIDNDGDGLIDAQDPKCASFTQMQSEAVVGTQVRTGKGAAIDQVDGLDSGSLTDFATVAPNYPGLPYPVGDSEAEVCGVSVRSTGSHLEGSLTATQKVKFGGSDPTGIRWFFTTTGGLLPKFLAGHPPFIGSPVGLCPDMTTPCLNTGDCAGQKGLCTGRTAMDAMPANTFVDLDGDGDLNNDSIIDSPSSLAVMNRCQSALLAMGAMGINVTTLASPPYTIDYIVPKGQSRVFNDGPDGLPGTADDFVIGHGLNVFNLNSLDVQKGAHLQINGYADSVVIFEIGDRLRLGRLNAGITLAGGIDERSVLFNLIGTGSAVSLGGQFPGTILAPSRKTVVRGGGQLNGAVFASKVIAGRKSRINHIPFTSLIPTDLQIQESASANPIAAGDILTYTLGVKNNGFAWAPAVTVTDTLDSNITFVSATASQGLCHHDGSAQGGVVKCFLGALKDKASYNVTPHATITIQVRVNCDFRGANIGNSASVRAETGELDAADNSTSLTTNVTEDATLSVSMSDSADPVEENVDPLEYTILVTNTGAHSCARNVSITDALPAALLGETVSIATSAATCPGNLTCTASCTSGAFPCNASVLLAGQTATVRVRNGKVADGTAAADCGATPELSNTVQVTNSDSPMVSATETTDVTRNGSDSCNNGCPGSTANDDCANPTQPGQKGFCSDGFCCNRACNGLCEACSLALNGQSSGVNGQCQNVVDGRDKPSLTPPPADECGSPTVNAVCNGGGACRSVELVIDDVTQAETNAGTTTFNFTVHLQSGGVDTPIEAPVTFTWQTQDGTATAPADYVAVASGGPATIAGWGTVPPGQTTATIPVTVNGDTIFENNETFTVQLTGATNADILRGTATGTIVNDDSLTVAIADGTATEGANVDLVVGVTGTTELPLSISFDSGGGTATEGTDYTSQDGGTIIIPAGTNPTATISVPTTADAIYESNETFVITLNSSNPSGIGTGTVTIVDNTGTGTITNDDSVTAAIAATSSATEGSNVDFTVSITGTTEMPITFNLASGGGTATEGTDYTSQDSLTVVVPAGTNPSAVVSVATTQDSTFENNETFDVTISNANPSPIGTGSVTISNATGTGTILNDDSVSISIADGSATEGSIINFTVSISGTTAMSITVNVASSSGSAIEGADFTSVDGSTVTIPAGTNPTATLMVQTTPDSIVENPSESFTVTISSPNPGGIL